MLPDHRLGDLDRSRAARRAPGRPRRPASRSSAAPGASKPAVKASTGSLFSRAISVSNGGAVDAAGQEHAVRHVAALVQVDAFLQRAVEPGQRRVLVDVLRRRPRAWQLMRRRSRTWPSAQVSVSPGSTRWMPWKMVSAPVVNCSCSSSSRAAGRTARWHQPGLQQRLRLRGEGQARSDLRDVERLDAERVARQRHACGCARSWMAMAYMPRSCCA